MLFLSAVNITLNTGVVLDHNDSSYSIVFDRTSASEHHVNIHMKKWHSRYFNIFTKCVWLFSVIIKLCPAMHLDATAILNQLWPTGKTLVSPVVATKLITMTKRINNADNKLQPHKNLQSLTGHNVLSKPRLYIPFYHHTMHTIYFFHTVTPCRSHVLPWFTHNTSKVWILAIIKLA